MAWLWGNFRAPNFVFLSFSVLLELLQIIMTPKHDISEQLWNQKIDPVTATGGVDYPNEHVVWFDVLYKRYYLFFN